MLNIIKGKDCLEEAQFYIANLGVTDQFCWLENFHNMPYIRI